MRLVLLSYYVKAIFWNIIQKLCSVVFGAPKTATETHGCLRYDVMKYIRYDVRAPPNSNMYLLRFKKVEDLSFIEREDVSFFAIENGYYTFLKLDKERCGDVFDVERYPFGMLREVHAQEIIRIREDVMSRYINANVKPSTLKGRNIYCLHNTGRCGSTLLTNMVSRLEEFQVLSEPGTILSVIPYAESKSWSFTPDNTQLLQVIRNVVVLTALKSRHKCYIKIHLGAFAILPVLKHALPEIRETFMYRSLKPIANSFKKVIYQVARETHVPLEVQYDWFAATVPITGDEGYDIPWKRDILENGDYALVHDMVCKLWTFQKVTAVRQDIAAYCYEDLLEHKEMFCKLYAQELGVNDGSFSQLMKGLEQDSQYSTSVNRESLKNITVPEISPASLEWGKKIGKEMGLKIEGPNYQFINVNCTKNFSS